VPAVTDTTPTYMPPSLPDVVLILVSQVIDPSVQPGTLNACDV
jgi:hypothetical protein